MQTVTDMETIHTNKFGKVDDCYYRGGQPRESDIEALAKLGIKAIINLRKPYIKSGMRRQKGIANSLGMNYYNIPLIQPIPPNNEQICQFFNILGNPGNLPVYVHCDLGNDRTGIMTALYRIRCYKWDFNQAYSEMKHYGYHRVLFPSLKHFLYNYVKSNAGL